MSGLKLLIQLMAFELKQAIGGRFTFEVSVSENEIPLAQMPDVFIL